MAYKIPDPIVTAVEAVKSVVDSIYTIVVSTETKVDTIDGVVDSIKTDTTSIESKVDTVDTNVDTLVARPASVIKSIQRGSFTMTGSTKSVTITSVDMDKSFLVMSCDAGNLSVGDKGYAILPGGKINTSTSLSFAFTGSVSNFPTVYWEVIEFN